MSILNKKVKNMSEKERREKLKELKMQLIKNNVAADSSKVKAKEIKKAIAQILTHTNK